MKTVDQFLKALAIVESDDNPEAWGDAGRAMGRWQAHPDRLWDECRRNNIRPRSETWDSLVDRNLRATFTHYDQARLPAVEIAMYWHLGHWSHEGDEDWDSAYAAKFLALLAVMEDDLVGRRLKVTVSKAWNARRLRIASGLIALLVLMGLLAGKWAWFE